MPSIVLGSILLFLLNLWDAYATWDVLGNPTYLAYEVNPFMRWALQGGPWCFFGVKMGLVLVAIAGFILAARRAPEYKRVARVVVWGLVAVYGALGVCQGYLYRMVH